MIKSVPPVSVRKNVFIFLTVFCLSFFFPFPPSLDVSPLIILSSCPTLYYSNYSHYQVTLETPLSTRGANSQVSLTLEGAVR